MNRRTFSALLMLSPTLSSAELIDPILLHKQEVKKFHGWIDSMRPDPSSKMVKYMSHSEDQNKSLSIIASTKLLLHFIDIKAYANASTLGLELVKWIDYSYKNGNRHTKGGLPSELVYKGNSWAMGEYYYASDNLIVSYAMYRLYQTTYDSRYAVAAMRIGSWLERTLFDGKAYQVWNSNYGAPMHYLRSDGAVDNSIHTAGDFLWLKALPYLHYLMPESGWLHRLDDAKLFMAQAQMPSGAWYTHFKPNKNSRAGKWYGYQGNDITIGDDNMRSALAAHHFGMTHQVEQFKNWLQPYEDVFLWGYLHTDKSRPNFLSQDTVYFDVVCTGLLRSWYQKTGRQDLALGCQKSVEQVQSPNGGWCWAITQKDLSPLNEQQAVITGCWALSNIDDV